MPMPISPPSADSKLQNQAPLDGTLPNGRAPPGLKLVDRTELPATERHVRQRTDKRLAMAYL